MRRVSLKSQRLLQNTELRINFQGGRWFKKNIQAEKVRDEAMQKKGPVKNLHSHQEISSKPWRDYAGDKKIFAIMHEAAPSFFRLLTKSLMCDLVVA